MGDFRLEVEITNELLAPKAIFMIAESSIILVNVQILVNSYKIMRI